jgi:hypothetical protein
MFAAGSDTSEGRAANMYTRTWDLSLRKVSFILLAFA